MSLIIMWKPVVISQDPDVSTKVKPFYRKSDPKPGPETVVVPDVEQRTIREAEIILKRRF